MENGQTVKNNSGLKIKNILLSWILPLLIAIAAAFLIKKYVCYPISVPTGSMLPTIQKHDRFMVGKVYNFDKLKRGDIIVFNSDELNELLIKRLIGLPNDHIEIKNGIVSVNGEVLKEDYVKYPSSDAVNKTTDDIFDVPEGKYFFLGDNRDSSMDARYWKNHYIDQSDIQGKALFRFYPLDRFGKIN